MPWGTVHLGQGFRHLTPTNKSVLPHSNSTSPTLSLALQNAYAFRNVTIFRIIFFGIHSSFTLSLQQQQ